ncbi:hypothetical protein BAE44_0024849 [Dichanthelium oligosanthes]|uniref:MADS-box domain-containing protein n=1 Tax=Dichanthelium oligosanthes TaxID=888268 RepID=A0A1E5UMN2_9POAL|nr:hypothetical protein BAE44_0024849 [Dichanthelium oligosanthes]
MPRNKVNLQWISNESTRRVAYKKRSKGLVKKTSELATLCGIKACVVVYGEGETQPEVWPSVSEATRVLERFKAMPEIGKFKKMQTQEDLIHGRISKLRGQVCKLDLVNREHETSRLLHESMEGRRPGLIRTTLEELTNLDRMVETKMAKVKELLQQHVVSHGALPGHPESSSSQQPPQASYAYTEVMHTTLADMEELQPLQQDWPTDLAPNEGEFGSVVCNGFVSSSNNGCAGPSSYGGPAIQYSSCSLQADQRRQAGSAISVLFFSPVLFLSSRPPLAPPPPLPKSRSPSRCASSSLLDTGSSGGEEWCANSACSPLPCYLSGGPPQPARIAVPTSRQFPDYDWSALEKARPATAQSTPRFLHAHAPATPAKSVAAYSASLNGCPNYISRTQASEAKVRSQSTPKQRPELACATGGGARKWVPLSEVVVVESSRASLSGIVGMHRGCSARAQEAFSFKTVVVGRIDRTLEVAGLEDDRLAFVQRRW